MSFKNLADLYEETVADLYKYDASDFNSGEPLYQNKLKPGPMGDNIKFDSRALPITSTIRDIERMAKFTVSGKGLLFMAGQQLLQAGNAFGQTTIINPAFVAANTVPFIHLSRHLSGLGILSAPDTVRGRLQTTTGLAALHKAGESIKFGSRQRAVRSSDSDPVNSFLGKISKKVIGGAANRLFGNSLLDQVIGVVSNVKKNLDPESSVYPEDNRPDIDNFDSLLADKGKVDKVVNATAAVIDTVTSLLAGLPNSAMIQPPKPKFDPMSKTMPLININRDYDPNYAKTKTILSYSSYRDAVRGAYKTKLNPITGKKESLNYNDQEMADIPMANQPRKVTGIEHNPTQIQNIYNFTGKDTTKDFIDVVIGVPSKNRKVQFRAFIKDLKHNAKPEYSATKYIGRTEKYVTYNGTSRTASFTLTLVAFSQEEINGMYTKLNYLVGLTFPLGVATGEKNANYNIAPQLLQPPMISLTIGKVFMDQPGYFESVNIQYSDTYDLEKQLPMYATVNISYSILEKETMFYTNPTVGAFQFEAAQLAAVKAAIAKLPLGIL